MPDCEICGAEDANYVAIVEGIKMRVCRRCSDLGKIVSFPRRKVVPKPKKEVKEMILIDDYAAVIREAREKEGLTRKELAALVDEKESYLRNVEEEKTTPTDVLAKKLEKQLRIKLFEEAGAVRLITKRKAAGTTLGDLAKVKEKKKKKK